MIEMYAEITNGMIKIREYLVQYRCDFFHYFVEILFYFLVGKLINEMRKFVGKVIYKSLKKY